MKFPLLPEGVWRGAASPRAAQEFLQRVEAWRRTLIEALRAPLPDLGLTVPMARFLSGALGSDVVDSAEPLPRPVRRFPTVRTSEHSAVDDAREVALWRARLIDYLADVWDVIGAPAFDLPECAAAERLLSPPAPTDPGEAPRCPACLELLRRLPDGSGFAAHDDRCPALRGLGAPRWSDVDGNA